MFNLPIKFFICLTLTFSGIWACFICSSAYSERREEDDDIVELVKLDSDLVANSDDNIDDDELAVLERDEDL